MSSIYSEDSTVMTSFVDSNGIQTTSLAMQLDCYTEANWLVSFGALGTLYKALKQLVVWDAKLTAELVLLGYKRI